MQSNQPLAPATTQPSVDTAEVEATRILGEARPGPQVLIIWAMAALLALTLSTSNLALDAAGNATLDRLRDHLVPVGQGIDRGVAWPGTIIVIELVAIVAIIAAVVRRGGRREWPDNESASTRASGESDVPVIAGDPTTIIDLPD